MTGFAQDVTTQISVPETRQPYKQSIGSGVADLV